MYAMFAVRSARALAPNSLESGLSRACRLRRHRLTPSRLPARNLAPHRMCPSLLTRQYASAFNQPLSFDTSKVTDMSYMFQVRSARALAPNSLESGLPPCMRRRRPTPSRLPACTSPRFACAPPFDSAVRARLQPAAEL